MPKIIEYRHGVPCWIDVSSPDVPTAIAFYEGLFGWQAGPDLGGDSGGYRMFQVDGTDVAGIGPTMAGPPSWTTYINVTDVDAVAAAATAAGGTVVAGPMDLPNGSGRVAFAIDPTGGFFALFQAGTHHGAGLVNEAGTLVWNELAVRDPGTALAFYEPLFGWTSVPMDEAAPDHYRVLQVQGRTIGGCMRMGDEFPPELPTHWLTYFAVDDPDAIVAKVAELGGTVVMPTKEVDIGRFAVLQDPTGAVFAVMAFSVPVDDPNDWPT